MSIHKAKKSLGQNFLKSETALRKIVEAGDVDAGDVILEIGPGKGALTEKLLGCVYPDETGQGVVIAVEKDRELFEFLEEKFAKQVESGSLVLVHGDILKFDVEKAERDIILRNIAQRDGASIAIRQQADMRVEKSNISRSYKLIANIPYNITGAILKKFLTAANQPLLMVLMVQHEVAQRILGRGEKTNIRHGVYLPKESLLSISVKAYGEPKMIMKVGARYFSPAPKVDSAIISIKNISRKFFTENKIDEEKFWEVVRAGFSHKRKKLSSNLKGKISLSIKDKLGNKRAEELNLNEWASLVK